MENLQSKGSRGDTRGNLNSPNIAEKTTSAAGVRTPQAGSESSDRSMVVGNPTQRSTLTPRTPPRSLVSVSAVATQSSPEDTVTEDGKRKRKEDSADRELDYLKETLNNTIMGISELAELVYENMNTKKEIKNVSAKLQTYATILDSVRIANLLESIEEIRKEDKVLKTARKEGGPETRSVGTQYQQEFVKSTLKEGNPLRNMVKDCDMVVWRHPSDPGMEKGIQKLFAEKYAEINQTEENIGHIKITTWVYSKGVSAPQDRHIFRIDDGKDEGETRQRLEELKTMLQQIGRRNIAMAWDDVTKVDSLREQIEEVMSDTEITTTIHLPLKGIQVANGRTINPRLTSTGTVATPRKATLETITVKNLTDTSYAKTLKDVKDDLIGKGLESNVQSVRQTKRGELLITLGKTKEGNDKVRAALTERLGKTNVRSRTGSGDEVTFHITGVDAVTTKEEIATAITLYGDQTETDKNGQTADKSVKVISLRPGFAGNQSAIVTVDKRTANRLKGTSHVKIGLSSCYIRERVQLENCFKCWATGHTTRSCKGPDRSNLCRNCGEEGHVKSACKKESKCVECGGGHPAFTTRCANFRADLKKASGKVAGTPKKARRWEGDADTPNTPGEWGKGRRASPPARSNTITIELTPDRVAQLKKGQSTSQ